MFTSTNLATDNVAPPSRLERRLLSTEEREQVRKKLERQIKLSANVLKANPESKQARAHAMAKAALHRLNNNQFGTCSVCDDPIEVGRQMAVPISEKCCGCKGIQRI